MTIAPKPLTVTGTTVKEKTYDGTVEAKIDNPGQLVGVCQNENVTLVPGKGQDRKQECGPADRYLLRFQSDGRAGEELYPHPAEHHGKHSAKRSSGVCLP